MWSRAWARAEESKRSAVQPYVYRRVLEAMGQEGQQSAADEDPAVPDLDPVQPDEHETTAPRRSGLSEDEARAREDRARAAGLKEGEGQARARFEREINSTREAVAQALESFGREREAYFCRVEAEVVKLAIGIARKILHREVQVDPLLLAGVVRVALEKITAGTSVRLRVHPDHVYAWHDFFANQAELRPTPELVGDATLGMGHCVLETALGTTELTLEAQLAEIERGFFDLLAQRPVTT